MPNQEYDYLLLTEVVRADGVTEKVPVGTARALKEFETEWEFIFERIPLSGKVWAVIEKRTPVDYV